MRSGAMPQATALIVAAGGIFDFDPSYGSSEQSPETSRTLQDAGGNLEKAKALLRDRGVAIAACEQSGRNRLPQVDSVTPLEAACADGKHELKLVLVPQAPATLSMLSKGPQRVVLLVGPEGGLSGREQLLAQRHGFQACRLGPRILRTETAPLAALAALQALAGDLAT